MTEEIGHICLSIKDINTFGRQEFNQRALKHTLEKRRSSAKSIQTLEPPQAEMSWFQGNKSAAQQSFLEFQMY